jgi:integrase
MPMGLRDTFASLHTDAGVGLTWVQAQLDHSDLTGTSRSLPETRKKRRRASPIVVNLLALTQY